MFPYTSKYIALFTTKIFAKHNIVAFKGKHLVLSKIEIDGSILEQVKQFNYFGCELSLDDEPDFDKKK